MTYACKYCGQIQIVPDDSRDPEKDAVLLCNCEPAMIIQRTHENVQKCKFNIEELVESETIQEVLFKALERMEVMELTQIVLTDINGVKYTVKLKTSGTFRTSKSKTTTESLE